MLYQCPDCKGKVSSDAPACPHCGKPIAAVIAADAEMKAHEAEKAAETALEMEKKREAALSLFKKKKWLLPSVLGAVAVIIALVLILSSASGQSFTRVGSYVTYGTYPQTAARNDSTPIEWLVLEYDAKNNRVLLISRYGLDGQPYNSSLTAVTWETCSLRTWLNGTFLNKAFSKAEQGAILTTEVDNSGSQCYSGWSTNGGNNTRDKIFLLSYAEVNKHFKVTGEDSNNTKSRVAPTEYAIARRGAYTSSSDKTVDGSASGRWWLRSPGGHQNAAAFVLPDGSLSYSNVGNSRLSVRPAFWLDLSGI